MIIVELNDTLKQFETFQEVFKHISKEGCYIDELTDTEIICTTKANKKETFKYGKITHEGNKESFLNVIVEEKDLVKKSMDVMMEQGIQFTPTQKNDLNLKFKIIKSVEEK